MSQELEFYKNIKVSYTFSWWITDQLQETIKEIVDSNVKWKLDWYLKPILQKDSAEILIRIRVNKNKQEKYEWSFEFHIDWQKYMYHNDVPFKKSNDLVNHAFDHLKRELSDK